MEYSIRHTYYCQEAALFSKLDTDLQRLIPSERFKAGLHAGEDERVRISTIVESQGIAIETYAAKSREPNTIYGTGAIEKIYHMGADVLNETIMLARVTWPGDTDAFQSIVLIGIAHFVKRYAGEYSIDRFKQTVGTLQAADFTNVARAKSLVAGGFQYMHIAKQFLELYNKGLGRDRKLSGWESVD